MGIKMGLNGIIISTQSPQDFGNFPRPGGTAWGLNLITGLPRVKMHRNGQATQEEYSLFQNIDNDGRNYHYGPWW